MQGPSRHLLRFLTVSAAALALSACSSTGGGGGEEAGLVPPVTTSGADTPTTITDSTGDVAGSVNLILTEISYFHPAQASAFDETYDIAATTLVVQFDDIQRTSQGTSFGTGGQFVESSQGSFGQSNTLDYDALNDTFTFNVNSGSVAFSETFDNVLLADPADRGLEFNDELTLISSDPSDFPLSSEERVRFDGNPVATQAFLVALNEEVVPELEEIPVGVTEAEISVIEARNDLAREAASAQTTINRARLANLQEITANLRDNSDFYTYGNGSGASYSHLNLESSTITTNYSTVGLWNSGLDADLQQVFGVSVFGQRTPLQDIPQTGTVGYSGTTVARLLQANTVEFLTGGINFEFDFNANSFTVDYLARLSETGIDGTVSFFDFDRFQGTGSISDDTFAGGLNSVTDNSLRGQLNGAFFGISAEEASGSFVFSNEDVQGIGGFVTTVEGTTVPDGPATVTLGN